MTFQDIKLVGTLIPQKYNSETSSPYYTVSFSCNREIPHRSRVLLNPTTLCFRDCNKYNVLGLLKPYYYVSFKRLQQVQHQSRVLSLLPALSLSATATIYRSGLLNYYTVSFQRLPTKYNIDLRFGKALLRCLFWLGAAKKYRSTTSITGFGKPYYAVSFRDCNRSATSITGFVKPYYVVSFRDCNKSTTSITGFC
ncbi:hypothetical protein AVEN_48772-1 [Araneus ventricosus]|uniref:Uncharacterized protein n=1 Tax=Araneus ventricosus TaxID=182803 RepID=A0A4Y2H1V6_ARAVE|nr:hypothetical protein AVEN_48772-1 [Araneus ventricosus]